QIPPGFIIKESWQGRSDGNKFFHSDKNVCCTIAIDPVISEGIVRIEVVFENTEGYSRSIGYADASCSFAAGKGPWDDETEALTTQPIIQEEIEDIKMDKELLLKLI
ncbi:MAG: hypothetical protein EZS28_050530, partial [Streblomastix strix]